MFFLLIVHQFNLTLQPHISINMEIKWSHSSLTDETIHDLLETVKETPITKFLAGNNIIHDKGIKYICDFLHSQNQKSPIPIGLWRNNIGVDGAEQIAEHLSKFNKIFMQKNNIGDQGAYYIGEALRNNNTLEMLSVEYNDIGLLGLMYIATALKYNTTLKKLHLRQYNLNVYDALYITKLIGENDHLTHIRLLDFDLHSYDPDTTHIIKKMRKDRFKKRINELYVVFYKRRMAHCEPVMKLFCEFLTPCQIYFLDI
jgi:hypothetical protein